MQYSTFGSCRSCIRKSASKMLPYKLQKEGQLQLKANRVQTRLETLGLAKASVWRTSSVNSYFKNPAQKRQVRDLGDITEAQDTTSKYSYVVFCQAMYDMAINATDEDLKQFGVPKGGRRVMSADELEEVNKYCNERKATRKVAGSLNNTLLSMINLEEAIQSAHSFTPHARLPPFKAAVTGIVTDDFYSSYIKEEKSTLRRLMDVLPSWQEDENNDASTAIRSPAPHSSDMCGQVLVLTSENGERSFLSYPGLLSHMKLTEQVVRAARDVKQYVVIEGYLLEFKSVRDELFRLINIADASNWDLQLVLTTCNAGVVSAHTDLFWKLINAAPSSGAQQPYVKMILGNVDEMRALCNLGEHTAGEYATETASSRCHPLTTIVATDGPNGAMVAQGGDVVAHVPSVVRADQVVSTNGAGDAFAAGVLTAHAHMPGQMIDPARWMRVLLFASDVSAHVLQMAGTIVTEAQSACVVQKHGPMLAVKAAKASKTNGRRDKAFRQCRPVSRVERFKARIAVKVGSQSE